MAHAAHLAEALSFQTVQALEGSHHKGGAALGDAGNLAPEAFLLGKVCIDLLHGDAENAVVRCSPDRSLAVISQFGNAVGAKSVVYFEAPDFPAIGIHRNDAVRSRGQEGSVSADLEALINLYVVPSVHSGLVGTFAAGKRKGVAPGPLRKCHADGIPVYGKDASRGSDAFKNHFSFFVTAHAHHAGDVGRVHNPPLYVVVDEKSLEVGKEDMTFLVTEDIEVTVVGIVLTGRVVSEERNAHIGGIDSILRASLHREKHHGRQASDMIQKLSHLNVI